MATFPKPAPRILERRDERREGARARREVYDRVAARDERRCRCCGRSGNYNGTTADRALHRHHVRFRSAGGSDTTQNLVTLCAYCHALIHTPQLAILGDDADGRLRFEIHEAAVVELFGTQPVPAHVHIVAPRRRSR